MSQEQSSQSHVLNAASITLTAAGDVRGGGTGREFLENLLLAGTESWSKWLHPGCSSSWVQAAFSPPSPITGYSLCSANDCPNRDPAIFDLLGQVESSGEWILLDRVKSCPFSMDRWEWIARSVMVTDSIRYTAVRLVIKAPRSAGNGIQLGHIRFYVKGAPSNTLRAIGLEELQRSAVCALPHDSMLPEYRLQVDRICLSEHLLRSCPLRKQIEYLLGVPVSESKESIFATLVMRGFGLSSCAVAAQFRGTVAVMAADGYANNVNFYSDIINYYSSLSWERPVILSALKIIAEHETVDGVQIVCGLISRASRECSARKRHVLCSIVRHCDDFIITKVPPDISFQSSRVAEVDLDEALKKACNSILAASIDFIEDYKLRAMQTTFFEPTRLYCNIAGDGGVAGDLDVHGMSTYLALIEATIGMQMNRIPAWDDTAKGCIDFLEADMADLLDILWRPENFGKSYELSPELMSKLRRREYSVRRVRSHTFIWNEDIDTASLAMRALASDPQRRMRLCRYLSQFVSYFEEDFLLPRLVTALTTGLVGNEGEILLSLKIVIEHLGLIVADDADNSVDVRQLLWDFEGSDLSDIRLRTDVAKRIFSLCNITK